MPKNSMKTPPITAVIGVWYDKDKTFYVKRSDKMQNYPLVWSLLSIQFKPDEFPDHLDIAAAQKLMEKMSAERLGGTPVKVLNYLTSATCSDNPMNTRVTLHLYRIEFEKTPALNSEFYTDSAWLTPDEYSEWSKNSTCGLCLRTWSDYCFCHGLVNKRFAPAINAEEDAAKTAPGTAPSQAPAWKKIFPAYSRLIADRTNDSQYLREAGLKKNLLELCGDVSQSTMLDAGCGTGWLLQSLSPKNGFECDLARREQCSKDGSASIQNVQSLAFRAESFDIIVASLLLMFIDDLDAVCREFNRVLKQNGHLIVTLTHPFSYRTGEITPQGEFLLTRAYTDSVCIPNLYIAEQVGPAPYFHRPISAYINALARAGFVVDEMREWAINKKDYEAHVQPEARRIKRTDKAPMYLFLKCIKIR